MSTIWNGKDETVVVYDAGNDALVHVTQDHIDKMQELLMLQGRTQRAIRKILAFNYNEHKDKMRRVIDALEAITEEAQ